MRWIISSVVGLFILYALTVVPNTTTMLFDFGIDKSGATWRPVNDGVMGGLSAGKLAFGSSSATFNGQLSLANNGGFASIRSPKKDYDFSGINGFVLRVKTDGRKYTFSLSDTYAFNGIYYEQTFTTPPDTWMEIRFPIDQFTGTYFGYTSDRIPALDPTAIKELGIVVNDKNTTPFSIELDWLMAY